LKTPDRVQRWILLLEEYRDTFEYLAGNVVAYALSCLETEILKIQNLEVLLILSESKHQIINIIQFTNPTHTVLIFKEQAKVKGLRVKWLDQPH
jgi:hypothetical protein